MIIKNLLEKLTKLSDEIEHLIETINEGKNMNMKNIS